MTDQDVTNIVNEINDMIAKLEKDYGEKISSITKQLNDLQNNLEHHSKKFIEDNTARLKRELDDVTKTLKKKTDAASSHIMKFNDDQRSKIQNTISNSLKSKIGIDVTLPQL